MSFPNVRVVAADASATTDGVAADLQVTTSKARLFDVNAFNNSAGTLYLQAFDAASEPAEGSKPKLVMATFAALGGNFDFGGGAIFGKGIYLCWSSTASTKTKAGATSGIVDATYRKE